MPRYWLSQSKYRLEKYREYIANSMQHRIGQTIRADILLLFLANSLAVFSKRIYEVIRVGRFVTLSRTCDESSLATFTITAIPDPTNAKETIVTSDR